MKPIRLLLALPSFVVATGLEGSFHTGMSSFLGRGESSTAAQAKAASEPEHTEVPEAQQEGPAAHHEHRALADVRSEDEVEGSRVHVPEAGLEFLRQQLQLGRQISKESLEDLFDESLIDEDEPMAVVNLGGLAAQYKDIDELVAKLGTQGTAKLLVNAEEGRNIAPFLRPGGAGAWKGHGENGEERLRQEDALEPYPAEKPLPALPA